MRRRKKAPGYGHLEKWIGWVRHHGGKYGRRILGPQNDSWPVGDPRIAVHLCRAGLHGAEQSSQPPEEERASYFTLPRTPSPSLPPSEQRQAAVQRKIDRRERPAAAMIHRDNLPCKVTLAIPASRGKTNRTGRVGIVMTVYHRSHRFPAAPGGQPDNPVLHSAHCSYSTCPTSNKFSPRTGKGIKVKGGSKKKKSPPQRTPLNA